MADLKMFCMSVTPFKPNGDLDEDALRLLLRRQIDARLGVLLCSGGEGEGHALEPDEARRVYEIGERIATGLPKPTDLTLLEDLSHDLRESGLCDHERLATLPFTSGMRYFRAEVDEHVLRSTCPAGVCQPIAVPAGARG